MSNLSTEKEIADVIAACRSEQPAVTPVQLSAELKSQKGVVSKNTEDERLEFEQVMRM